MATAATYEGRQLGWMNRRGMDPRWLPLAVTTLGSFMTLLDSTIVNVALPSIIRDFDSRVSQGQLVLTGYLLALATVIPLSGFLADKVGMKRLYVLTLMGFTLSSGLCALAWSMPSLIAFRAIQGLAGGMLQPLAMAIVFSMITPLERARFMVILGLPMLLGPLLGPTVGGYLVEYVSWRSIFLINLPVGVAAVFLCHRYLQHMPPKEGSRLDGKGFILGVMAFPMLLLGLSEGTDKGWDSPLVLVLLPIGALSLVTFVFVELRQADPLLQLRLFRNRMFSIAVCMTLVTQFCFFGSQFLLPLFLQNVQDLGAGKVGLTVLPTAILDFVAINISGKLYNRLGPRPLAVAGFAFMTVTALGLSFIDENTSLLLIAGVSSLRGLGMGLGMMAVTTMAFNTVPQGQMPRATALQNVLQRIFGSVATAVLTTVLILSLQLHGAPGGASITSGSTPDHFLVAAFGDAFLVMSAIGLIGVGLSFLLHDQVLREHLEQKQDEGRLALEVEPG
jgi:EmrB/QacA subfamily drug resistance transporter